jgi:hypothetical protein
VTLMLLLDGERSMLHPRADDEMSLVDGSARHGVLRSVTSIDALHATPSGLESTPPHVPRHRRANNFGLAPLRAIA